MYDRDTKIIQKGFKGMKKSIKLSVIIFLLIIIAACNKNESNVIGEINQHIEDTVEIEMEFEASQERIAELEEKDQEIYDEIIQLGSDGYDDIVKLADEATELLEERLEIVDLEKESIELAQAEFEEIESLIEDIADKEEMELTKEMYDSMIARYDSYDVVYKHYINSVRLTKDLYAALKEEDFKESDVYAIISDVNESYDDVADAFETFNKETNSFNHFKEAYYENITEK